MRMIARVSFGAALLGLAACGGTAEQPVAEATAADNVVAAPSPSASVAAATPLPVSVSEPGPGLGPEPGPAASRGTVSCAADIGAAAAGALAKACRSVSPATRPPCHPQNSCAMIRAEIARACSVIDDGTAVAGCTDPAGATAAADVVSVYYDAIDARDFATAWQLWDGDGARSGKTLAAFERGFADTVASEATVGTPGASEGAAGSSYVTVPVTVRARLADGTRQRFAGSYVLRRVNVERSQGWRLYSARLRRVG